MSQTKYGKDKTVLNLAPEIKQMLQACAYAERRTMTSMVEVLVEREFRLMVDANRVKPVST